MFNPLLYVARGPTGPPYPRLGTLPPVSGLPASPGGQRQKDHQSPHSSKDPGGSPGFRQGLGRTTLSRPSSSGRLQDAAHRACSLRNLLHREFPRGSPTSFSGPAAHSVPRDNRTPAGSRVRAPGRNDQDTRGPSPSSRLSRRLLVLRSGGSRPPRPRCVSSREGLLTSSPRPETASSSGRSPRPHSARSSGPPPLPALCAYQHQAGPPLPPLRPAQGIASSPTSTAPGSAPRPCSRPTGHRCPRKYSDAATAGVPTLPGTRPGQPPPAPPRPGLSCATQALVRSSTASSHLRRPDY